MGGKVFTISLLVDKMPRCFVKRGYTPLKKPLNY